MTAPRSAPRSNHNQYAASIPEIEHNPEDCLVLVYISSQRVVATIAWCQKQGIERVSVQKEVTCDWYSLQKHGKIAALKEAIGAVCASEELTAQSVFVCIGDENTRGYTAVGATDIGQVITLTQNEVTIASRNAAKQPIGVDREVLHELIQYWTIRDEKNKERMVSDPIGERASSVKCHMLLVTTRKKVRQEISGLLAELNITLEGLIAAPVALHRGFSDTLNKNTSSLIIDCGARFTHLLVHQKKALINLQCYDYGGIKFSHILSEELHIDYAHAEALKRNMNIATHFTTRKDVAGQGSFLGNIQGEGVDGELGTAIIRESIINFFETRRNELQEWSLLTQVKKIHLVGRGSSLQGLPQILEEIFQVPVIMGSGDKDKEPSTELSDLAILGFIRLSGKSRKRLLSGQHLTVKHARQAAFNLWAWISHELD